VCYVVWFFTSGHTAYTNRDPTARGVLDFIVSGLRAGYSAMGQLPSAGLVLAVILIAGLAIALRQRSLSGQLRQLAAPLALLVGSVVMLAITGTGRLALGVETARASRYVHLVAAMTVPALAVAADAVATRWRSLLPVAIAVFVVGIPGNIRALGDAQNDLTPMYTSWRQMILSLPRDPFAREVPRSLRPERATGGEVTIGWLLDGVAQHRIPAPGDASPRAIATAQFRLSFDQRGAPATTTSCRRLTRPLTATLGRRPRSL
jgi:hypothetical protein